MRGEVGCWEIYNGPPLGFVGKDGGKQHFLWRDDFIDPVCYFSNLGNWILCGGIMAAASEGSLVPQPCLLSLHFLFCSQSIIALLFPVCYISSGPGLFHLAFIGEVSYNPF